MKLPVAVTCCTRLLESLLPRDISEFVAGDLAEEYRLLRAQHASGLCAIWWLTTQTLASLPRLWVHSLGRFGWLRSLGAAVIAYVALGFLEPRAYQLIATFYQPEAGAGLFVDICVGSSACALGGFLATWMHRGSAVIYSAIGTGVMSTLVYNMYAELPLWFLIAFVFIALFAPIVGGAIYVTCARR